MSVQHTVVNPAGQVGFLAQAVLAGVAGFSEILASLYRSLAPKDELQRFLVDQIAITMLRLQRVVVREEIRFGEIGSTGHNPFATDLDKRNFYYERDATKLAMKYEGSWNRQIARNLKLIRELHEWAPVPGGEVTVSPPVITQDDVCVEANPPADCADVALNTEEAVSATVPSRESLGMSKDEYVEFLNLLMDRIAAATALCQTVREREMIQERLAEKRREGRV